MLQDVDSYSKNFMAPVQKLNNTAIANREKVFAFPTANLQKYAQLGLAQWRGTVRVALAPLADCLGDDAQALVLHLVCRVGFIERLPQSGRPDRVGIGIGEWRTMPRED